MAQTIQVPLAGGGSIQFEVDDASSGWTYQGAVDGLVAMANETFQAVIGWLKRVAETPATELFDLAPAPDRVAIEFGVRLNTNAGVVIAKAVNVASLKGTRSRGGGLNLGRRMHPELP